MSPWISEGSLLEQGVRMNSSLRLKTGIQELQHKAWSGLLHPSSILFSYHGAHQEADLQLCYVGACLPVWLLGKETKKQKLKKKKKVLKVLEKKKSFESKTHSRQEQSFFRRCKSHASHSWFMKADVGSCIPPAHAALCMTYMHQCGLLALQDTNCVTW